MTCVSILIKLMDTGNLLRRGIHHLRIDRLETVGFSMRVGHESNIPSMVLILLLSNQVVANQSIVVGLGRGAHGTVYTIKVSCEFYDALSENGVDGLYKASSRG